MESLATTLSIPENKLKRKIRVDELSSLIDQLSHRVKVLSLDCFDTLLWRKTATPIDVFYDLQNKPNFESLGITARLRCQAEQVARQKMQLSTGITEVKLHDIYLAGFPHESQSTLDALAEDELAAEFEACYAYPPMLEMIEKAHAKGLKIIIVSDTYFNEAQLRRLLQHCLPENIFSKIKNIFCSCEYGQSKSQGLFKQMMKHLQEKSGAILHIGDNLQADFISAHNLGLHTAHLVHHDAKAEELLRMQGLAGTFLDHSIRSKRSLTSLFRGVLAAAPSMTHKPESILGYTSVGPIMYAFARFIIDEIKLLENAGKRPKVVFLMRDGYLPSLVCEALAGKPVGKRVRISRFASFAASFRSKTDIDRYLIENVNSLRFQDMGKQLLLPEKLSAEFCTAALKADHPAQAFIQLIQQQKTLDLIFKNSLAYRKRLQQHLHREVGLEKGDTLVFVDLGYTGTSQLKLEPLFREEMGVDIIGRYLIALSTPGWKTSRKGLLDPSWCDERTLLTLTSYITLLEQMCTANENSVINYEEDGSPIYSGTSVSKNQHKSLDLIQSECLRFVRETADFFKKTKTTLSMENLRDLAMADLGRLLFFPTESEIHHLKSFEFELNLGTKDLLELLDPEKGLAGLRRRGLFFMERNLKSMRTNYPSELRSAGLELVLTLLAQHRLNFDVIPTDLSLRRESINVIVMRGNQATQAIIEALPTHDGYFALLIPIGDGSFQVGVQFGLLYQWLQLESADLIDVSTLYSSKESEKTLDATENLVADQMMDKGSGLYECLSKTSLLMFVPTQTFTHHHYCLRLVFRPIARKTTGKEKGTESGQHDQLSKGL